MIDLIKEIENCVKSNNLRCALEMALTLPDICGIIEYPAEKSSKNRYVKWCEKYLFNQGYYPYFVVDDHKKCEEWEKVRAIEPAMCYKLRCAFLHSGNLKLNQKNNDNFPVFNLHISSSMENGIYVDKIVSDSKEISMDIRKLARLLCNAAKDYYDSYEDKQDFIDHHI